MRTIKFLGIAVALAAVSVSANAQPGRRSDHSSVINDLASLRGRFRAGGRTNASPEQQQLTRQCREQRRALRAQVQAGTLTREQSRYQMKAWTTEHRPTK